MGMLRLEMNMLIRLSPRPIYVHVKLSGMNECENECITGGDRDARDAVRLCEAGDNSFRVWHHN